MPETKPFMPPPMWNNLRYGRHTFGRGHYYDDVKQTVGWFSAVWKRPHKQRYTMRMCKVFIICALIVTCVVNLKLAIEAKIRYEQHRHLFSDSLDFNVGHSDYMSYKEIFDGDRQKKVGFEIEVLSSRELVEVKLNGDVILHKSDPDIDRGIHVVTLNQFSGAVMAMRSFDTYMEDEENLLRSFVETINDEGRVLIFAVKDEASFNLKQKARETLQSVGSAMIMNLQWRGMWAMITHKNGRMLAEDLKATTNTSEWAKPVQIRAFIEPASSKNLKSCKWPGTVENIRRQEFCSKFDGYGDLCSCESPSSLSFKTDELSRNLLYDIPVVVIASNRPQYLYRMLTSLLSADGANPTSITVFIDGHFDEPMQITKLLGVRGIFHAPAGVKNARISQNYRSSLSAIFGLNPEAKYAIVLEEDLDVSPDLLSYFNQTLPLMEADSSIYCVSAWNDHGYEHSTHDPTQLYRVEGFPGLGWLLSRKLFKEELEPIWPGPDKPWDWDMWMRQPSVRKGRECVIPDVPRTFHFGTTGLNMNSYFHRLYFSHRKLNEVSGVVLKNVDSLIKDNYENLMHLLIRQSALLDHSLSPCDDHFIPESLPEGNSYVAYIQMTSEQDSDVFKKVFKCLKIWDLDVRGLHKNSFRTYVKNRHVIFVGYPHSPYSIYKPVDSKHGPIVLEEVE